MSVILFVDSVQEAHYSNTDCILTKLINCVIDNSRYPGPGEEFPPDSDAALVTNVYKNSGSKSKQDKQKSSQGKTKTSFVPHKANIRLNGKVCSCSLGYGMFFPSSSNNTDIYENSFI